MRRATSRLAKAGALAAVLALMVLAVPPAWAAAPTITSFDPTSGAVGTTVTITGTGFQDSSVVTSVAFNGTAATFTVNSDAQIIATVPSGAATGPITVTDGEGTASSAASFTVPPPAIADFSPSSGTAGTKVTITGTGFTGATSVEFNGKPAASFTVVSDTTITARVPSGAGSGPISISTPGFAVATSEDFRVLRDKHNTNLTFDVTGHLIATGEVRVPDDERLCRADRKVIVEKRISGNWRSIRSRDSRADGSYRISLPDQEGTYRARVQVVRSVDDLCQADTSATKRHEHVSEGGGGGDDGGGGGGGNNCDPSYPDVCIPPPPPDLDCGQIPFTNFRVVGDDPHGFDGDNDGIGCEA